MSFKKKKVKRADRKKLSITDGDNIIIGVLEPERLIDDESVQHDGDRELILNRSLDLQEADLAANTRNQGYSSVLDSNEEVMKMLH